MAAGSAQWVMARRLGNRHRQKCRELSQQLFYTRLARWQSQEQDMEASSSTAWSSTEPVARDRQGLLFHGACSSRSTGLARGRSAAGRDGGALHGWPCSRKIRCGLVPRAVGDGNGSGGGRARRRGR